MINGHLYQIVIDGLIQKFSKAEPGVTPAMVTARVETLRDLKAHLFTDDEQLNATRFAAFWSYFLVLCVSDDILGAQLLTALDDAHVLRSFVKPAPPEIRH